MTMGYFAVTRNAGPGWSDGKGAFEQLKAGEHASFMKKLAEEGFLMFAGPLAGSEADRIRILLMVSAETEAEVRDWLADDPWARSQQLGPTALSRGSRSSGWSGSEGLDLDAAWPSWMCALELDPACPSWTCRYGSARGCLAQYSLPGMGRL
jgi:uncharacterized protein YciI